ncbi:MAG TPA: hypothetical protein VNO14_03300 [Blastocatellia bacterium]|nr:hypothetical protein [Blastocatellia bacterium]
MRSLQTDRQPAPAAQKASLREFSSGYGAIILIIAHAPLGLIAHQSELLATIHAIAALGVGLSIALSGRNIHRVAYVAAYIAGSEVLWRMSKADINWEYGKYSLVVIMIIALLRRGNLKVPALPFIYFMLLIPSSAVTLMAMDLNDARKELSFNLSGPLALMVCAWFFYNLRLTAEQLRRAFLSVIAPLVGVAAVTLFGTVTTEEIAFSSGSNLATSGGFAPNQVSAALGMGVLVALLCVLDKTAKKSARVFALLLMIFLAVQSALTFSRGGLYNAAGAVVLASFYLLRDRRSRTSFIIVAAVIFVVGNYIVIPQLNEFTDGAFQARFEDLDLTKRDKYALSNLEQWMQNPILGAGPGQSWVLAHTEFSRLPAEHGLFGFIALLLLLIFAARIVMRTRNVRDKAVVVALIAWSLLFMLNAAMRLVAPSFMFGLACVTLAPEAAAVRLAIARRVRTSGWTVLTPSRFARRTM